MKSTRSKHPGNFAVGQALRHIDGLTRILSIAHLILSLSAAAVPDGACMKAAPTQPAMEHTLLELKWSSFASKLVVQTFWWSVIQAPPRASRQQNRRYRAAGSGNRSSLEI